MSEDEQNIKGILNDVVNQPELAKKFFSQMESDMKDLQKSILDSQNMLDMLNPLIKDNPQYGPLFATINAMMRMSKTSTVSFRFIYNMLEALVLKSQNQKPLSDSNLYNNSQIITERDRKNLDWLNKYFEHTKGEDVGQ